MISFEDPIRKKQQAYEMASRAELTNFRAKIWFNRPPFYMQYLESWTTGKEKEDENG